MFLFLSFISIIWIIIIISSSSTILHPAYPPTRLEAACFSRRH